MFLCRHGLIVRCTGTENIQTYNYVYTYIYIQLYTHARIHKHHLTSLSHIHMHTHIRTTPYSHTHAYTLAHACKHTHSPPFQLPHFSSFALLQQTKRLMHVIVNVYIYTQHTMYECMSRIYEYMHACMYIYAQHAMYV